MGLNHLKCVAFPRPSSEINLNKNSLLIWQPSSQNLIEAHSVSGGTVLKKLQAVELF